MWHRERDMLMLVKSRASLLHPGAAWEIRGSISSLIIVVTHKPAEKTKRTLLFARWDFKLDFRLKRVAVVGHDFVNHLLHICKKQKQASFSWVSRVEHVYTNGTLAQIQVESLQYHTSESSEGFLASLVQGSMVPKVIIHYCLSLAQALFHNMWPH